MTWHIVSDTSCDLFTLEGGDGAYDFTTIPFTIRIGDKEYVDDERMPVEEMLTDNETNAELAQTSCPAPEAWLKAFSVPGPVVAFTISSALSGSYNSACTARNMILEDEPDRQIAVIDSKATGPELVVLIRKAQELILAGKDFNEVEKTLNETAEKTHIIFALASYHNLIKAGRVSRLKGLIAGHLGFWGIGIGDENGEIAMRGKARGDKSMVRFMTEEIRKIGPAGKKIVICHCQNEKAAEALKNQLLFEVPNIQVDLIPTRGLDSFYAERHGLIVAF